MGDAVNQNNFSNNQNASVDIEELYITVIKEIEKYRSYVSISNNNELTQQLISSLNNNSSVSPDSLIAQVKSDPSPQESRCHTFYRLIGLPVISPEGTLYNPGFDADNCFKSSITQKHYKVILSIENNKPALFDLMDARENNVNSFLKVFSSSNLNTKIADINGSVLLLSSVSGGKNYFSMRHFGTPLDKSTDSFDTDFNNQSYTIANGEPKNSVNTADLTSYQDVNGNFASLLFGRNDSGQIINPGTQFILKDSPLVRRAHILKPFMVDPRVDLTVNPPRGIICAPFALDNSKTKYNNDTQLIRPFLELVCRKRFNKDNQQNNDTGLSARYTDLISFIKSTDKSLDSALLNKVNKGITQTVETDILLYNLDIIRAMVNALFEALGKIQDTENQYHWIPIPDSSGPETAIGTQDIKLIINQANGTAIIDPLSTPDENSIITLTSKIDLANPNTTVSQTDLGNFAFQGVQPIPDGAMTSGFNVRSQAHLDDMIQKRTESTNNAAAALRIIEIIMGEFSGLGLADIIAIYTALWTVDKNVLVNMLDDEAFDRLYQDSTLQDDEVVARKNNNGPTMSGDLVLQGLEDKIKEIYALMDALLAEKFGS